MSDDTTARVVAWVVEHTGPLRPLRLVRCQACAVIQFVTRSPAGQFHIARCPRWRELCPFTAVERSNPHA